jgi:tRNA (guanine37-N1)-methyltransferase
MKRNLVTELSGVMPDELQRWIPRSFDIIGGKGNAIAIVEISPEIEAYQYRIAEALVHVHSNVRSVLSKGTERQGELRVREMKLLYGDPDTEVTHRENGCWIRVDPVKVYFSPRECTEREKIMKIINQDENILVMFSGVGPFAVCIAKHNPSVTVTAVELNPDGHLYCLENIRLNKLDGRVKAFLGDVRTICPSFGQAFDRVLMPLPKGAYQFLDVALKSLKTGGILHFYHWSPRGNLFVDGEEILLKAVSNESRTAEIIDRVKVSQYSPSTWKIRIDARII